MKKGKTISIPTHDFRVIDMILARLIHTIENPVYFQSMWGGVMNDENLKELKRIRKHIRGILKREKE